MKKIFFSISLLVSLCLSLPNDLSAQTDIKKGEEVIMTGFDFKNPVINSMIDADKVQRSSSHSGNLIISRELNKIPLSTFPDKALWVCRQLHDKGYKAYIVGGSVRDLLMHGAVDDADLVTNATYDQQREIFGDSLVTHVFGEKTFGIVKVDGTEIDLAAFSHCPGLFIDRGIVKGITKDSVSIITDSYERDLPFNAVYYDPYTGEIIDFHGGLEDMRDNTIHTSTDPDAVMTFDPSIVVRVIRFQAKFNSTLSTELEQALLKKAPYYMKRGGKDGLFYKGMKMFQNNYSLKCYKSLLKYRIFDSVFPCTSILKDKKKYNAWLETCLPKLDSRYASGEKISGVEAFATITYPVYKQLRKKHNPAIATKKIIDLQTSVMKDICDSKTLQTAYEEIEHSAKK